MTTRIGPRLTLAEQRARKPENWGKPLAMGLYADQGILLRARDTIGKSPREIQALASRVEGMRRIDLGIKMITIPAGRFIFKSPEGFRESIWGKRFKIAETEFTNGQFRRLLELKPQELSAIVENPQERLADSIKEVAVPAEAEDCPMVYVSQLEWKGIAELLGLRLLTEKEWVRAAAGTKGRRFSFGDDFDKNKANFGSQGIRSVLAHRIAATPEGVLDLSGNVWEWTSSYDNKHPDRVIVRGNSCCNGCPDTNPFGDRDDVDPDNPSGAIPEVMFNYVGVRFADNYKLGTNNKAW